MKTKNPSQQISKKSIPAAKKRAEVRVEKDTRTQRWSQYAAYHLNK